MSVQDLTNTTWIISYDDYTGFWIEDTFSINFSSTHYNDTFNGFGGGDSEVIYYLKNGEYSESAWDWGTAWSIGEDIITITGGSDVTRAELISWLEENATQVAANLSNTMWIFNDTPTLSNVGTFDLDFNSNDVSYNSLTIASSGLSYGNTLAYGGTGYTVNYDFTEYNTVDKIYLEIYDGQDTSGTLLVDVGEHGGTLTGSVVCTSGYLYVYAEGDGETYLGVTNSDYAYIDVDLDQYRKAKILTVGSAGSASFTVDFDV